MRVGLDARTLAAQARSGVEHYVVNLVRAFSRMEDAPEIVAYVDRPIADPEVAGAASAGPLSTRLLRSRFGWLRLALPFRLWRDGVDLVHLPSTILPPLLPCPAVVTVHDLAWMRYPETYQPDDLRMQRIAMSGAAARAAAIIAVSESTARDLGEHFPRCADRVAIIPLGVSPRFSPEGLAVSKRAFPGAERLGGGYVLYAGGLQPRKNLRALLAAYRALRSQAEAPPLVLVGKISPHAQELMEEARRLSVEQEVIFAGYLPDDMMPALYRGATIFVYPSRYEGFGLPVLEAMASGTPVVTSSVSAMPEVAGEAALLVSPESAEELAGAMARLLADAALQADLRVRGLARARLFTWEETARRTVEVYRRALPRTQPNPHGRG